MIIAVYVCIYMCVYKISICTKNYHENALKSPPFFCQTVHKCWFSQSKRRNMSAFHVHSCFFVGVMVTGRVHELVWGFSSLCSSVSCSCGGLHWLQWRRAHRGWRLTPRCVCMFVLCGKHRWDNLHPLCFKREADQRPERYLIFLFFDQLLCLQGQGHNIKLPKKQFPVGSEERRSDGPYLQSLPAGIVLPVAACTLNPHSRVGVVPPPQVCRLLSGTAMWAWH